MSFDETLHPRGQAANAGQFIAKTNAAPAAPLATATERRPYAVRWAGETDVTIASGTNPWLQTADGKPIYLTAQARVAQPGLDGNDCECFDGPVPGVLAGMDSPEGVQRCDACARFDGDLEAARALANQLRKDLREPVSVWFTPAPDPKSGRVVRRTDGRLEVADEEGANVAYGCRVDDWCILADGHDGDCNEDREFWEGPDELYPAVEATTWYVVRTSDNYYAETVNGTREEAERAASEYRPNPWTEPGLAYVVPAEPEYPAATSARSAYGDSYGDYIQRSLAERLSKGYDRRDATLGDLLSTQPHSAD